MLQDIFGFADHQEKGTYGLGYKLTLTRNSDNAVLNKADATNNDKLKLTVLIGTFPIIHHHLPKKNINWTDFK